MQQCDSKYVVKYYGSYFKNSDLWVSYSTDFTKFIIAQFRNQKAPTSSE